MDNTSSKKKLCRKWSGVFWLVIEVNLIGGTIFGFPALFKVLANEGIYKTYCVSSSTVSNSTSALPNGCNEQTQQYQVWK